VGIPPPLLGLESIEADVVSRQAYALARVTFVVNQRWRGHENCRGGPNGLTGEAICRSIGSDEPPTDTRLNRMIGSADFPKISHLKKCAFLAAFSRCGSLSKAAKRAKVDRRTHYNWLKNDPW